MKDPATGKELPKGVSARKTTAGIRYDAYAYEKGERITLGNCDTPAEAEALRYAYFQQKAAEGEPVPDTSGVLTLRQLGALYFTQYGTRKERDRWAARIEGMAEFIDWPITQIDEHACRLWIAKMAKTPIAKGRNAGLLPTRLTINSSTSLLRSVFGWACMPEQGYLTRNPMPLKEVTLSTSTKQRLESGRDKFDYLREAEALKLWNAPERLVPLRAKTIFLTLMLSGARPGAIWALDWADIDWASRRMRIQDLKNRHREITHYEIHMLPQLFETLAKWHLRCGRRSTGLVFQGPKGKPHAEGYDAGWSDVSYRPSLFRVNPNGKHKDGKGHPADKIKSEEVKVRRGYRSKLGITRDAPLYSLRHTLGCNLLLGTQFFTGGRAWSREEVQGQLGHKDPKATEHYMRALGIRSHRAAQETAEALRTARKAKR